MKREAEYYWLKSGIGYTRVLASCTTPGGHVWVKADNNEGETTSVALDPAQARDLAQMLLNAANEAEQRA